MEFLFLSLFLAHDLIYLFNFVIQRLRKEKKRERKNKEFYVHRRKKKRKKKETGERNFMRSESQESTAQKRKFAKYLEIESLGKTLGFLLLPR